MRARMHVYTRSAAWALSLGDKRGIDIKYYMIYYYMIYYIMYYISYNYHALCILRLSCARARARVHEVGGIGLVPGGQKGD